MKTNILLTFTLTTIAVLSDTIKIKTSKWFNLSIVPLNGTNDKLALFSIITFEDRKKSTTTGFVSNLEFTACKFNEKVITIMKEYSETDNVHIDKIKKLVKKIDFADCFQQTKGQESFLTISGKGETTTESIEQSLFKEVFSESKLQLCFFFMTLKLENDKTIFLPKDRLKNNFWHTPITYELGITRTTTDGQSQLEFSSYNIKNDITNIAYSSMLELTDDAQSNVGGYKIYTQLKERLKEDLPITEMLNKKEELYQSSLLFTLNTILTDNYSSKETNISKEYLLHMATNNKNTQFFDSNKKFKFIINKVYLKNAPDIQFNREFKKTTSTDPKPTSTPTPKKDPTKQPAQTPTNRRVIIAIIVLLVLLLIGVIVFSFIYDKKLGNRKLNIGRRRRRVE